MMLSSTLRRRTRVRTPPVSYHFRPRTAGGAPATPRAKIPSASFPGICSRLDVSGGVGSSRDRWREAPPSRRRAWVGPAARARDRSARCLSTEGGDPTDAQSLKAEAAAEVLPENAAADITYSTFAEVNPHLLHVPVLFLSDAFLRKHGVEPRSQFHNAWFGIEGMECENDGTWFTATYHDPITGEHFSCGIGRQLYVQQRLPYVLIPPLHRAEAKIEDGKVYYPNKQYAKNAAAARAIDCYLLREGMSDIRLCLEEPYKTPEEGASQDTDYNALISQRSLSLTKKLYTERRPNAGVTFSSAAASKPYRLQSPKMFLHDIFNSRYGLNKSATESSFATHTKNCRGMNWFTSTFEDPITKETFSSGLGCEVDAGIGQYHCGLRIPLHKAEISIMDGKIYYLTDSLAEHAAAARAIDCYIFREDCADKNAVRLCHEDPYLTPEEGASQKIDYRALLSMRTPSSVSVPEISSIEIPKRDGTFSSMAATVPHKLHVPKMFLYEAYQRVGERIGKWSFAVEKKECENVLWFTATFKDPITKERFSSGLGCEVYAERKHSSYLTQSLHEAEVKIMDGKVYYLTASLAEHAAAARAIDCCIFREDSDDKNAVRLCHEDPYTTPQEGASQKIDYRALLSMRNNINKFVEETGFRALVRDLRASQQMNHTPIISKPRQSTLKNDDNIENDQVNQENDLVDGGVPDLTFSFDDKPMKMTSNLSTLGRMTELWTDTNILEPSNNITSHGPQFTAHDDNILGARSTASKVGSLLEWFDRVNSEPQNREEAHALAQLCKKILKALGQANSDLDADDSKMGIDVEEDAKIILAKIISLSKKFENESDNKRTKPLDADTFNAYIHCLGHNDHGRSEARARDLLQKMLSREKFDGIELPLPNVGTFNAVMSLCALDSVSQGVNDVYALLEAASSDRNLCPNEETFKILLSANSRTDGLFSFEQAKLWLDKIRQISGSLCGAVLVPDADVFSAAFRSLAKKTKTNSNQDPWTGGEGHGHRYRGGFKSDGSSDEARNLERWLLHAEECQVEPSAEMYEAVIQAWTETGTKEGLLTAEEWARRAVSSSSKIRLETFQPIIASWAQCQIERAPDRVNEWMAQLTAVSASKPHLRPNLMTLAAPIIAWRNVQAGILARSESSSEGELATFPKDVERTFVAAQNCNQYLMEVFSNASHPLGNSGDMQAFTTMFTNTIEAWGCASRFALQHPTNSVSHDASHGIDEMLKLALLFDPEIDGQESKEHAQFVLQLMGKSLADIISQLHQIDSSADSGAVTSCLSGNFPCVERMVRDYEFYSRKLFPEGDFHQDISSVRHHLYKEFLQACLGIKSPADYGHVMRVCTLIMDSLSWHKDRCDTSGGLASEDISVIFVTVAHLASTIVRSPYERMYVLTMVYNNASEFFEERTGRKSSYAMVDKARLIGAMRISMGESDLTEDFISDFDQMTD